MDKDTVFALHRFSLVERDMIDVFFLTNNLGERILAQQMQEVSELAKQKMRFPLTG